MTAPTDDDADVHADEDGDCAADYVDAADAPNVADTANAADADRTDRTMNK